MLSRLFGMYSICIFSAVGEESRQTGFASSENRACLSVCLSAWVSGHVSHARGAAAASTAAPLPLAAAPSWYMGSSTLGAWMPIRPGTCTTVPIRRADGPRDCYCRFVR
ncbi:hypothetical protein IWX46DRAFT_345657 [Phyllosticta citricarpa]|uniref:Secreted protein n=1 Tax=Phyllosticta citricarpa TaxID=55181 RepID=A0ABR1ML81_9PEZI